MIEIVIPHNADDRVRTLENLQVRALKALGWRFQVGEKISQLVDPKGNIQIDRRGTVDEITLMNSLDRNWFYYEVAWNDMIAVSVLLDPAIKQHGAAIHIGSLDNVWVVEIYTRGDVAGNRSIASAPIGYLAAAITAAWLEWHEAQTAKSVGGDV